MTGAYDQLLGTDLGPLACATPADALERERVGLPAHFRRDHFPCPAERPDAASWCVAIGGLVVLPRSLALHELRELPRRTQRIVLECAGHRRSEFDPMPDGLPWGVGAVGEAYWTGVRLADVLALAGGVQPDATAVVLEGADAGEVPRGGIECFSRALPLDKALDPGTLVAFACDSEALPVERGGPVRAIVPGWYATDSVKWLHRIEVIAGEHDGWYEAHDYRLRAPGESGAGERLGQLPVHALILGPADGAAVEAGRTDVTGIAWGGSGGVAEVWVKVDDGRWLPARLGRDRGRFARRFWGVSLRLDPGEHTLAVRARDAAGDSQPLEPPPNQDGYANNSVHRVRVLAR